MLGLGVGLRLGHQRRRAGAVSSVTWNPADKNAAISLSNLNLTATQASGSLYVTARATAGKSSGKYHVEFQLGAATSWNNVGVGFATSALDLGDYISVSGQTSIGLYGYTGNVGEIFYDDAPALDIGTANMPINGARIAMEVDFAAGKLWVAKDSADWNGNASANPVTGVGGFDISVMLAGGAIFPAVSTKAVGDSVTLKPRASDFTRAVSSGYSPWDAT